MQKIPYEVLNVYRFTIYGTPVAKARPRKGKNNIMYTPKKTQMYEQLVKSTYIREVDTFIKSPIIANIDLYFDIPKSYSKKKRKQIAEGKLRYTKKPDKDNCEKAILDALNDIAYKDDSQVIGGRTTKNYTINGVARAEIELIEIM